MVYTQIYIYVYIYIYISICVKTINKYHWSLSAYAKEEFVEDLIP